MPRAAQAYGQELESTVSKRLTRHEEELTARFFTIITTFRSEQRGSAHTNHIFSGGQGPGFAGAPA